MAKKRRYGFALPYDLGWFQMGVLKNKLISNPNYGDIPQQLRQKLEAGQTTVVQKEDLDMLPDHVWEKIAAEAGLQYEYYEDDSEDFELGEEIGGPAPSPRPPVKQPDTAKAEALKKASKEQQTQVRQAAKTQPATPSKGKASDVKGKTPQHGGTSKK